MKRLCLVLLLAACSKTPTPPPAGPAIPWLEDQWSAALQRAQSQQKPILIAFHAPWCIYCNILEATILREPEIVALAEKFVPLKIDVDKEVNRIAVQKFKEFGVPLFVAAASNGTEFSRLADPSSEGLKQLMAATLMMSQASPAEKKFYAGLKYQMLGQKEKAGVAYRNALPFFEKNPGWELAAILNFQAEEEGSAAAAIQFLKTFAEHPLRPLVWGKLAELQTSPGAKNFCERKAWEELEKYLSPPLLEKYSQYELIYLSRKPALAHSLGIGDEKATYREIAGRALTKAKKLPQPFLSKPYWMRAMSWNIRGGNPSEAVKIGEKMIREYAEEFTFFELLAWAHAEKGDWEKAITAQEKVVALAHEMAKPRKISEFADLFARKGDFQKAIALLNEVLALQSANSNKDWIRRERVIFDAAKKQIEEYSKLERL